MKSIPTIRSRMVLMASLTVVFWFFCFLFVNDRINRIKGFEDTRMEISLIQSKLTTLSRETEKLIFDCRKIAAGSINTINGDNIKQACVSINASLTAINSDNLISGSISLKRKIGDALENVKEINRLSDEYLKLIYERGDLGQGLLNQWYQRLQLLFINQSVRFPSSSNGFLKNTYENSLNYLYTLNADYLQVVSDRWKLEKESILSGQSLDGNTKLLISDFFSSTDLLILLHRKTGLSSNNGLQGEIQFNNLQLQNLIENISSESTAISETFFKKLLNRLTWVILLTCAILIGVFYSLISISHSSLQKIKEFLVRLKSGEIPDKFNLNSGDELEEMAEYLNAHVDGLNRKISFADRIGEGKIETDFQSESEKDVLGNSLLKMAHRLSQSQEKDQIHKTEDQKRQWISEGMASFGEIFRSERDDLNELAFKVIKNLVKYLNANQGAIYLSNHIDKQYFVEMVAAFAFDRRKHINKKIFFGEGIVGTCAIEKETIYLTEIPDDYLEITSGLGEAPPRCILMVPLKLENELFGILEVASFNTLKEHEINFTEQLGESIATTLAAVRINEKTVHLLEQSQKQAEVMARQEEKMRINVQELQDAQEESRRKETEITGILNAVNSSSLVAEYSINGRFADINEKFLILLEAPRDQVVGKHHSDFAVVDKYSEDYKEFWKKLREGNTISLIEQFKLFNGKDLWLNHTYTPILDKDNKPFKILNIAYDITQSKKQQEGLESQANEIIRKNLEMESFSNSVDASIIKCELSPEAIILNVNENYIETTGYSGKEMLGKNIRLFLKDIEKQQFDKIWAEVIKEKLYTGVIRRTKPTGEEKWLMATFAPVKNEEGDIYKTYFLAQDITEKKLKYQLLEEANLEIERLRQRLNDLNQK